MVWVRKMLTTDGSDPGNAPGHAIGLRVAECFAVEPPLGNRISHIVSFGFFCNEHDVEETIVLAVLNIFSSGAKVTPL
jgi:hypothetical protein